MYRSLIILLLCGITSVIWSQDNFHSHLVKKLASDAHDLLFKKGGNRNENMFSSGIDSIINYKLIRYNIINKACDYLGVSYRYGQSSEKGFDCSGFVKFIFRYFGLELPHSSYSLYKISKPLETSSAQSGDLVFFITRGKRVSHVGIYLGNNQFIHSPGRGRTVSIDSLNAHYYKRHLVGFGSVL